MTNTTAEALANAVTSICAINVEYVVGPTAEMLSAVSTGGVATNAAAQRAGLLGGAAGLLVQPAVWVVQGHVPDVVEATLWGAGATSLLAGAATLMAVPLAVGGIAWGAVNGRTADLLEEVRAGEPAEFRNGIFNLREYSTFAAGGGASQMAEIANHGGVSWTHPNGLDVFIRDATGNLCCDYEPVNWIEKYNPVLPIELNGSRFIFDRSRNPRPTASRR